MQVLGTPTRGHAMARVNTFAFSGIEAVPVEVQVQISAGAPAFLLVGLPDKAVGEARERVRAAFSAIGLSLPPRRVLINLKPADLLKEGSHFDLPIALGVLAAMDVLPRDEITGYAALGELSLDGALNPVAGVLPAAMGASARDLGLICPAGQGGEAAWWRKVIKSVSEKWPTSASSVRLHDPPGGKRVGKWNRVFGNGGPNAIGKRVGK